MATTPTPASVDRDARLGAGAATRVLVGGEAAWLALLPCVAALLVAIVALGPPLGRLLFAPPGTPPGFWPYVFRSGAVRPEPVEHARYALALVAPLLLCGLLAHAARRPWRVPDRLARVLIQVSQALAIAFLGVCVIAQHRIVYGLQFGAGRSFHRVYFSWTTLAVSVGTAALLAALLARERATARLARLLRDTSVRRGAAIAVAVLLTATWELVAFNTDGSIGMANRSVSINMPFWVDETFGVLNGRAPLVNFYPQYSQLWPYVAAAAMSLLGTSLGVYSAVMVLGSASAMLAIYAVLRRVVRNALIALALYVPLLATGFFTELGPPENRYAPANLLSEFPMRYGGPYLLAWLMARRIDGAAPRRRVLLFLVAGLVAINNTDFGLPAVGATIAAELWSGGRPTRAGGARLARDVVLGIAAAAGAMALLTLAVAGSLPHFGLLFKFAKLYAVDGFGMLPMPTLGFHLVVYATFAATLVVATVRALAREQDRVLTGMLAWSGVFGLGAGSYFVGRSHPEVLIDLFSAWALALTLLVVVAARAILARPVRRPRLPELAVLAGFGIALCSVAQTPAPWSQIARIGRDSAPPALLRRAAERFVASAAAPTEPISIIAPLGHRIAYDIGRTNLSPYASVESMPAVEQLRDTLDRLHAAGGHLLFVNYNFTADDVLELLVKRGFRQVNDDIGSGLIELSDARRARPPARR